MGLTGADIAAVELTSFHEATRLYREVPTTSPVAQYSVSYPVAAALVKGRVGVAEIEGPGLADPEAARLVAATTVHESAEYNARFPADRWGEVTVVLKDGRRLDSGPRNARGGPERSYQRGRDHRQIPRLCRHGPGRVPRPGHRGCGRAGWRNRRRPSRR